MCLICNGDSMKSACTQTSVIIWVLIKITNNYGLINSAILFCKFNITNH